jgi:(4S)-4-hydroxy-5-phosphonooxypentane-2,3-dione isomerase
MGKLANVVTAKINPAHADRVLAALLGHKERSLRDEPGTLVFEVLRPRTDDSILMTYEVYQDEAAFEVHRASPSLAQMLKETENMIFGLSGIRCDLAG